MLMGNVEADVWLPSAEASAASNPGAGVGERTETRTRTRTGITDGEQRALKEPPAPECSAMAPLFYCKSHLKGGELKGIIALTVN